MQSSAAKQHVLEGLERRWGGGKELTIYRAQGKSLGAFIQESNPTDLFRRLSYDWLGVPRRQGLADCAPAPLCRKSGMSLQATYHLSAFDR